MKDFIIHIEDLVLFRARAKKGIYPDEIVEVLEENGDVYFSLPHTAPDYKDNESVSIVRVDEKRESILKDFPEFKILGEGQPLIRGDSSVSWTETGESEYLRICPRDFTFLDDDGNLQEGLRPTVLTKVPN